jgi:hypothetical protein
MSLLVQFLLNSFGIESRMQFVLYGFSPSPIPSMNRARGITFSPNRILKKTTAINRRAAIKSENRKKHRMHCK